MTPNHKQYDSTSSHNVESQALIADETIEQEFSSRRRPLLALFLGIALATIAVGSSMVHQTFGAYQGQINAHEVHIALLRKELNEVKSNLEVATVVGDEFESRDLGTLGVGEQCFSNDSCASGSCLTKPYAFCSGAPTASPTITAGSEGYKCNGKQPRGPDCQDGLYCPKNYWMYGYTVYYDDHSCTKQKENGSKCNDSFECVSHYCSGSTCIDGPPTPAPVPDTPANKGRCGPLFGGRMCACTYDEFYCNSANGYCGYTTAHRDAQKNEDMYDCEWSH